MAEHAGTAWQQSATPATAPAMAPLLATWPHTVANACVAAGERGGDGGKLASSSRAGGILQPGAVTS
jgi:hypothetical protein